MATGVPSHLLSSGGGEARHRGATAAHQLGHSSSIGSFLSSGGGGGGGNGSRLGSRHASHSTLKEDAINDWLSASGDAVGMDHMPPTPTMPCEVDAFIVQDHRIMDDMTTPAGRWNAILEGASSGGAEKSWGDADVEFQASALIANLHVDDLFDDCAPSPVSSYGGGMGNGVTLNLPGWNHGPEYAATAQLDSDADSPDGVWCAQGSLPTKSLRRSAKLNTMASVSALHDGYGSPGAGLGLSIASPSPADTTNMLGAVHLSALSLAPPRSLRQCISAPQLQRDDGEVDIDVPDLLAERGFTVDLKTAANSMARIVQAADLVGGASNSRPSSSNAPTINITLAASTGGGQGTQPSALFQRRAVQREGNMPAPSPVAVDNANAQSQQQGSTTLPTNSDQDGTQEGNKTTQSSSSSLLDLDVPLSQLSASELENLSEEQKQKLAQIHQLRVAQQAARLGVYSDFVAPSQQFAGQEASERAAKAVQAALLYGMEGNAPRRLSVGSTGLPTPISPQHPLHPAPGYGVAQHHHYQPQPQFALPPYQMGMGGSAAIGGRMPGMPMSAVETSFPQSIYYAQHQPQPQQTHGGFLHPHAHLHPHSHSHQAQAFTAQYYQRPPESVFMGQQGSQDMAGYTSTYPPPRADGMGGPSGNGGAVSSFSMTTSGGGSYGERSMPRSAPGDLASEIAANPMQLQVPYTMLSQDGTQQNHSTPRASGAEIGPVHLHQPVPQRPSLTPYQYAGGSFPPPAGGHHASSQSEPRSAPGHIETTQLSMQQQQQQQQRRQVQGQGLASKASMPALSGSSGATSRKHQPSTLLAPLSPPRSPMKMKSSPSLRPSPSPPAGSESAASSSSGKSIRKIASNKRINASLTPTGGGVAAEARAGKTLSKAKSMMMEGLVASPTSSSSSRRMRTMSHASLASATSSKTTSTSGWKGSKSPTPIPGGGGGGGGGAFNFSALSFVNYGMEDADELCSAVAPSGSYKVPLKGYGSSGSESRSDDEDDDDGGGATPGAATPTAEGSSPKKARRNSSRSRTVSRAESLGNLRAKRSGAAAAFPLELRNDPRCRERSESVVSRR